MSPAADPHSSPTVVGAHESAAPRRVFGVSRLALRALERELVVFTRNWRGLAFSSFVQPVLFLGAMGLGVGGMVEGAELPGGDYLTFVAPGMLVATTMLIAAGDSLWGVMAGFKYFGHFTPMVSTPVAPGDVYAGIVLFAGCRAAVASVVFLGVAGAFGALGSAMAPLALVPAVVVSMAFSAWMASYTSRAPDDLTFPVIMRIGVVPLFFFSGTFFPIDQLPTVAQALARLSPLYHAAEAARDCTAGGAGWGTLGHVGVLGALVLAAVPFGVRGFRERLMP